MQLLIRLRSTESSIQDWWNAGLWFALYLVVSMLIGQVRSHDPQPEVTRLFRRTMVASLLVLGVLLALGMVVQGRVMAYRQVRFTRQLAISIPTTAPTGAEAMTGTRASKLLTQVIVRLRSTMYTSRSILLGSRDPNESSCVTPLLAGDVRESVPNLPADIDGGPGTRMGMLVFYDRQRVRSAATDLTWQQGRLRTFLENSAVTNEQALDQARQLAAEAAALAAAINSWSAWPGDFAPSSYSVTIDWPRLCMTRLNEAVGRKDLDAAKRWSTELASTTFGLADLHRWLQFLIENQLVALDFQRTCSPLFAWADPQLPHYNLASSLGQFPAGVLLLGGMSNFYEVERQAEQLFARPRAADELGLGLSPGTAWLPPALRATHARLGESLSTANRRTWDLAARTPFERSYLVNMLHRHAQAGTVEPLAGSLRVLDRKNPAAPMSELMDVLMYRGHSFAGLEWSDRYQPLLMEVSQSIQGSGGQALREAGRWANGFCTIPEDYGISLTLREALARRKIDCIRTTDMIASLYRGAGGTNLGFVWWTAGTVSHSVAAHYGGASDLSRVELVDGFAPTESPELWPQAYFRGHPWPPGMEFNHPMYAAELYVRGLDSYIWAEGYVVRGPSAGMLSRAAVPYLNRRGQPAPERIFRGPYPE